MDYQSLKSEIKEIVEISLSVPEQFQQKCFETLLNSCLRNHQIENFIPENNGEIQSQQSPNGDVAIPMSTQLRLFMRQQKISKETIETILFYDGKDISFVKEPQDKSIRQSQIYWSLLIGLKNCILKDNFEVDPEDVRSICKAKGYYDATNFAKTFKAKPYITYFKGVLEAQGEPQQITSEGQTALATLIKELAGPN